ncbi:hypothetical protein SAMN05878482_106256 [Peribacillus simplex]|uniref:Uncharacterized protein n=1 Tax=Peribacillus simplex TaxID=1478 RepID=A0A9X8RC97_9BACI|nr:hypothetical protein SAMN05878482_106256 [Peribacillus simplex]
MKHIIEELDHFLDFLKEIEEVTWQPYCAIAEYSLKNAALWIPLF